MQRNLLKGFSALLLVLVLILSLAIRPESAYAQVSPRTLTFDGLGIRPTRIWREKGFLVTASGLQGNTTISVRAKALESLPRYESNVRPHGNPIITNVRIIRDGNREFKFLSLVARPGSYGIPPSYFFTSSNRFGNSPFIRVSASLKGKEQYRGQLSIPCPLDRNNPSRMIQCLDGSGKIGSPIRDVIVDALSIEMIPYRNTADKYYGYSLYQGLIVDNIELEPVDPNQPPTLVP
ncbi:MAG: hypothetical protein J7647_18350 [Cyanobacteria bacterium SBLK]|nr:hypothetical protein [Cyanobacteria bacterium SBLK]